MPYDDAEDKLSQLRLALRLFRIDVREKYSESAVARNFDESSVYASVLDLLDVLMREHGIGEE